MEHTNQPVKGGYRANAGRKKKYGENTKVLTIRVPESKIEHIKAVLPILINNPELVKSILLDGF